MNTIQYMGSKADLLSFLENSIAHFLKQHQLTAQSKTFFDAFAGSGRVSYHFRHRYQIIANDKLSFPQVILTAYLRNPHPPEYYAPLIAELNSLSEGYFEDTDQWFTETYTKIDPTLEDSPVDDSGKRKIWRVKNGRKIDMIRHHIDVLHRKGQVDDIGKNALLLALILGVNKVSNVVGHQNGYLKEWCSNANRDLVLEIPELETVHSYPHELHMGDIFDVLKIVKCDIAYFDPPYGTNNKNLVVSTRYSSFYHLWNTLALNLRPEVFGKASKPVNTSGYTEPLERNRRHVVMPKFIRLIEEVQSRVVVFSYSNKGLLTARDFEEVYRLSGCDMSTFRLYITPHKVNNQTQLAKKDGSWIDRPEKKSPLMEYLFVAQKEPCARRAGERVTTVDSAEDIEEIPEVSEWLSKAEDYSLPEQSIVYVHGFFLSLDAFEFISQNQIDIGPDSFFRKGVQKRTLFSTDSDVLLEVLESLPMGDAYVGLLGELVRVAAEVGYGLTAGAGVVDQAALGGVTCVTVTLGAGLPTLVCVNAEMTMTVAELQAFEQEVRTTVSGDVLGVFRTVGAHTADWLRAVDWVGELLLG